MTSLAREVENPAIAIKVAVLCYYSDEQGSLNVLLSPCARVIGEQYTLTVSGDVPVPWLAQSQRVTMLAFRDEAYQLMCQQIGERLVPQEHFERHAMPLAPLMVRGEARNTLRCLVPFLYPVSEPEQQALKTLPPTRERPGPMLPVLLRQVGLDEAVLFPQEATREDMMRHLVMNAGQHGLTSKELRDPMEWQAAIVELAWLAQVGKLPWPWREE